MRKSPHRARACTIAVSGARGGHTVDFRALAHQGVTLVGLTESFVDGVATFRPDLAENLARGDENYLALLDAADAYIAATALTCRKSPRRAAGCRTRSA